MKRNRRESGCLTLCENVEREWRNDGIKLFFPIKLLKKGKKGSGQMGQSSRREGETRCVGN